MNMPSHRKQKPLVPKKRSNSKSKVAEFNKRARRGVLGLQLSWHDADPMIETANPESITHTEVWHSNPTQRLICQDMWRRCSNWIVTTEFTWLVMVSVVYQSNRGEGIEKRDEAEFRLTCGIRKPDDNRLNDAIENFITESRFANYQVGEEFGTDHKSYGKYLHTEFVATVVGI